MTSNSYFNTINNNYSDTANKNIITNKLNLNPKYTKTIYNDENYNENKNYDKNVYNKDAYNSENYYENGTEKTYQKKYNGIMYKY